MNSGDKVSPIDPQGRGFRHIGDSATQVHLGHVATSLRGVACRALGARGRWSGISLRSRSGSCKAVEGITLDKEWVYESFMITTAEAVRYGVKTETACWYEEDHEKLDLDEAQKVVPVDEGSMEAHLSTITQRLTRPGIRLGRLLNHALSGKMYNATRLHEAMAIFNRFSYLRADLWFSTLNSDQGF